MIIRTHKQYLEVLEAIEEYHVVMRSEFYPKHKPFRSLSVGDYIECVGLKESQKNHYTIGKHYRVNYVDYYKPSSNREEYRVWNAEITDDNGKTRKIMNATKSFVALINTDNLNK